MQVTWVKRKNGNWYSFREMCYRRSRQDAVLGLAPGVYVIWQDIDLSHGVAHGKRRAIYVGSAVESCIRSRLLSHSNNEKIMRYGNSGQTLYVSYANLYGYGRPTIEGVERFLHLLYNPEESRHIPNVPSIEVNTDDLPITPV